MTAVATTESLFSPRSTSLPTFFDNLGSFTEVPAGVAKLRELILDLAVRGKLVEQDPNDEPASRILDRFKARWTPSQGSEKRSRHKPIPPIESEESLTETPRGWEKARLGHVYEFVYGQNLPKKDRVDEGDVLVYGSNGPVGKHNAALVNEPSIVIGRKGSSGMVNLAMEPFWPIDTTYFVTPTDGMDLTYSFYLLRSLKLDELGSSIIPGLNRDDAYVLPVLIPPLPEQRRIVAKVDSLMSQCDELESRGSERVCGSELVAVAWIAWWCPAQPTI